MRPPAAVHVRAPADPKREGSPRASSAEKRTGA